jgi:O-antigen ligase
MNPRFTRVTPFVRYDAGVPETTSIPRLRPGPLRTYGICALVVVLCLVYLDIPAYIYTLDEAFLPKYFFYAFVIIVAPLLVLRSRSFGSYLVSPFSLWAFALVVLNCAHLLGALLDGDKSTASLIDTRIQYAVLVVLLGFACSTARPASFERIFPFLAVLIPALVIWDFLSPGLFYPIDTYHAALGRGAATFINPNKAGEAMLLTFVLALPVLRPNYRALLLLLLGAGVIVTFSRAAIVGWILLWVFLLVKRALPKYTLALPLVALGVLPLLLSSFEDYLSGREDLAGGLTNIQARLEFFQDQVLDDDSALERAQVMEAGVELFRQNPIFGAGAGATYLWSESAGTHNLPVMLGAEYGVFGIALWMWLTVILWRGSHFQDKRLQVATVAGFVFLSMVTHNMFDSLYWLLTFAIVAAKHGHETGLHNHRN